MRLIQSIKLAGILAGAVVAFPAISFAQTCVEPTGSQFKVTTLVAPSLAATALGDSGASSNAAYGPVGMSIAKDGRVFVGKMGFGTIVVYDPRTSAVTPVGKINTYANTEDGLLGIVLDNNFANNHWLYAFYSDPCGMACASSPSSRAMELARYTVDTSVAGSSTTLGQLTKKKVILRFPRERNDNHHAAGGLSFDASGVLVIGVGDNTDPHNTNNNGYGPIYSPTVNADAQRTASNTNDLRGKVLRIKPIGFDDNVTRTPGIDSTYSIPSGNLWEKINSTSFNPGWDNTDSISKVRKEIYAMGDRNPYHPRVDNRTGWIFWGEVGPDANSDSPTRGPSGHDEFNLASGPGFFGHPYCNGYNVPYNMYTSGTTYGSTYNCAATVNNSPNNTGIHHLPPAIPALAAYTSGNSTDDDPRFNATYSTTTISHAAETAIGAPMYRYDTALASTVKWPPYYEGKIFFFDWSRRNLRTINIDSNGTIPAGAAGVHNFPNSGTITGLSAMSLIDAMFGPEGALYLLKFGDNGYTLGTGPGLYRIDYTGSYDNSCYKPFVAKVGTPVTAISSPSFKKSMASSFVNGVFTLPMGYKAVEFYNIAGRQVWSFRRLSADFSYDVKLPKGLTSGLLQAKLIP